MIIEEEKVEIVDDEQSTPKKEKNKDKNISKTNTEKKETNVAVKEEKEEKEKIDDNNSKTLEKKSSNQILESIETDESVTKDNTETEDNQQEEITETSPKINHETFETSSEENAKKKHPITIFLITLLVFITLIIIAFGGFTLYNYKHNSLISKGVYINTIDVSNLTKEQAKEKLENYYANQLSNDITLVYNDYKSFIKPSEIDLSYDINSAIEKAYSYGKDGNVFQDNYHVLVSMINNINIIPTYTLNDESLTKILNNMSTELPDALVESSNYVEGNNLVITKGKKGSVVDTIETINNIKIKIADLSYINSTIPLNVVTKSPQEINIDQVYNDIHKDPKDAYYTKDPYTIYPSENGVDFKISIEEAKQIVQNAESECEIPLKVLYPNVTTNMIGQEAFPDLLGSFSTYYVSNADRTTNLRLAANKINGTVLMPGEVFSYNGVVGARTIAAGYKNAAIYQDGQVVDGLGGGICQISSTLYNAALFANLEMVELYNHQFVPSYVTAGRDATVVYGVKDFKFKNSRKYAIKITCSVSGGIAKFQIWGVKEPTEYDISVYANVSRTSSYIKATTYRTLKLNGETVKTEKISNSTYKVH